MYVRSHESTTMFPVTERDCAECSASTIGFCANLGMLAISKLAEHSVSLRFRKGQTVEFENGTETSALILRRGMVKISHTLMDGRQQIIDFLSGGDLVVRRRGEAEDSRNVTATTDVEACGIDRTVLTRLCEETPEIGESLLDRALREIDRKAEQMTLLGRKRSDERVASFLLDFSARAAIRGEQSDVLTLPMSRAEIADYLSLTAETVSRAFSVLRDEELIRLASPNKVELCDVTGLRHVAGGGGNLTVR